MFEINKKYIPLFEKDTRYFVITGGRGSSKSFSVNTFLLMLTYETNETILFTRYTLTSANVSIIPEFIEKIEILDRNQDFDITKDAIINKKTGSKILFKGIKTSSGNQTANLKSLSGITCFVLDEADRMLDMGFVNDVKKIIKLIPKHRQSIFFSATMPDSITQLASSILTQPQYVEVTPVSSTVEIINQSVYFVDKGNKNDLLLDILQDTSIKTALVFTRTKHGADKVVKMLLKASIKAEAIHGNKSQNARQSALKNFKAQTTRVLVATDIAARGIDVDELEYVINFELSNIAETYVHRIGRTGRAGNGGIAISFCSKDEEPYWKDIQKLIKVDVQTITDHPYPWHSGSPAAIANKPNNSNRSGGAHKSRKSNASKQNKKRWY